MCGTCERRGHYNPQVRHRNIMLKYFRNPVQLEQESIRRAMERACTYANGVVLDIGCGGKPYADLFIPLTTAYFGTDIDIGNDKRVDIRADSLSLPIKDSSVGTVVSNQTLEHVRSPELFFAEATRVLKAGGVLIVTAPQVWCLHEKPDDYYRFTRYALEWLCQKNGLEVLVLDERYGAFAAIGQMSALMVFLPNAQQRWRTHLARLAFGTLQFVSSWLDRWFYYPDLTLGYILVARKHSFTS
jgi:SAM-dependent methyltransferase